MTLGLCLILSAALFCIGLYGLLTHRHAIGLLTAEVDRVLGQLGCNSLSDLGPHLLVRENAN